MTTDTRDHESGFIARGGWWVVAQFALMIALVAAGPLHGAWLRGPAWADAAGLAGIAIGAWLGLAGVRALRTNRTPFPRPLADSTLVQTGIYARVRHPVYASLIWLGHGWSIAHWSGWALLLAVAQHGFLLAKARREERWLVEKFPEYAAYASRVNRFLPRAR